MKKRNNHEEIIEICRTALTFTEVEARLSSSTPNTSLRRYIRQHKIDMPCYEGKKAAAKLSGKTRDWITDAHLCENSEKTTGSVKKYLIDSGKKEKRCEKCGWCEKRQSDGIIPIHLHHKNGNSCDNRMENLEFLCPNCHSLTDNYAGKNKKSVRRRSENNVRLLYYSAPKHICQTCGKLGYGEKYCSNKCSHESQRKVAWPTKEQLSEDMKTLGWTAIGRKYGVSNNATKKWARHYELLC